MKGWVLTRELGEQIYLIEYLAYRIYNGTRGEQEEVFRTVEHNMNKRERLKTEKLNIIKNLKHNLPQTSLTFFLLLIKWSLSNFIRFI